MALVGFLFVVAVGLYLIVVGVLGVIGFGGFTNKIFVPGVIIAIIGCALLYVAYLYAPISLTVTS